MATVCHKLDLQLPDRPGVVARMRAEMTEYNETAQLQLGPDKVLFGQLLFVDREGARMRPFTDVPETRVPPSTAARLLYFKGPRLIAAPASVEPVPGGDLQLSFTGAHQIVERRYCERVPCELTVSYRSVRTSNTFSAWTAGVAHNISSGGLGLWIDTEPPASGLLDLHIFLPSLPIDVEMEALFAANPNVDGSKRPALGPRAMRASMRDRHVLGGSVEVPTRMQLPPLRMQSQIRHMRRTPKGPIYVGLRFTAVTPTLYWQLSQLVQTLSRTAS